VTVHAERSWAEIDGPYRYILGRAWGPEENPVLWVMLNPSTADAEKDDPTIRRCISFSKAWGHGALVVVNLYALRSTDPRALLAHPSAVGPSNDAHILAEVLRAGLVVAAWGAHPAVAFRAPIVSEILGRSAVCLGHTAAGHPRHPLYVKGSAALVPLRRIH
jgi:hypothetical protein